MKAHRIFLAILCVVALGFISAVLVVVTRSTPSECDYASSDLLKYNAALQVCLNTARCRTAVSDYEALYTYIDRVNRTCRNERE